jgi:antitoxin (DNA-binding transcriptional repressor) of toxin-antitoxin stability system
MKTATVADLRNNFRRVSAWIEHGETVQILKRGKVFARLTAAHAPLEAVRPPKPDIMAQLKEVWGDREFSLEEVEAMRQAELEGEEG